jgi:hypothetical protein
MSDSKITQRRGCSIRLFDPKKWFSGKANLVSRIVIERFKYLGIRHLYQLEVAFRDFFAGSRLMRKSAMHEARAL